MGCVQFWRLCKTTPAQKCACRPSIISANIFTPAECSGRYRVNTTVCHRILYCQHSSLCSANLRYQHPKCIRHTDPSQSCEKLSLDAYRVSNYTVAFPDTTVPATPEVGQTSTPYMSHFDNRVVGTTLLRSFRRSAQWSRQLRSQGQLCAVWIQSDRVVTSQYRSTSSLPAELSYLKTKKNRPSRFSTAKYCQRLQMLSLMRSFVPSKIIGPPALGPPRGCPSPCPASGQRGPRVAASLPCAPSETPA